MRLIAIYLPQYHPIPENNQWWGNGFTEWTNVIKARPLFIGHHQPNVPKDLGLYDLRVPEVREAQAKLARNYGLYGFAYYHYWFKGKRLLERPFKEVLEGGSPDFPFCLFWANETWSRRWMGDDKDILLKQSYSSNDDIIHIRWLIKAFSDYRYITINGRPVFIIYRPLDFPNIQKTIEVFKSNCIYEGLPEPYIIGSNSHSVYVDLRELGFDAILNFEPQLGALNHDLNYNLLFKKLKLRFDLLERNLKIYDYTYAKEKMMENQFNYPFFPCSFVNWDNSPRIKENGTVIINGTPEKFKKYLIMNIKKLISMNLDEEEDLIFINAWNEWAEGNYLEPDTLNGSKYLEAVKDCFTQVIQNS